MRNLLGVLIIVVLLAGPALAQDDFLMPGETTPEHSKDASPPVPWGWKWRFQMGGHVHLKRDSFWDNRNFEGDSETRIWLSWDLGLMNRDRNLNGWGGGVFGWVGGDYDSAWGLKGYRRWALGSEAEPYFQIGPGIILGASDQEQEYGDVGVLLEAELGARYVALCTSVTFLPYTGRGFDRVWNGQSYDVTPGQDGLDVAWNLGMKVAGPFAGLTTTLAVAALYIALQSLSGLD